MKYEKKRMLFSVPESIWKDFKTECFYRGTTMTDVIVQLMKQQLKKWKEDDNWKILN